jgi:hypothetical protein
MGQALPLPRPTSFLKSVVRRKGGEGEEMGEKKKKKKKKLFCFFVLDRWQSPLLTLGGRRDALQTSLINNAIKKPIYTKRG